MFIKTRVPLGFPSRENLVFVVQRRVDDGASNSRAQSRTRTKTTKKAFPETTIPSRQHDARRRFQDGGRRTRCQPSFLGVSTRTRYFPFSRDESNASLAERFAAPSSSLRRQCHSASVARFWRRQARDAVRGVLLELSTATIHGFTLQLAILVS